MMGPDAAVERIHERFGAFPLRGRLVFLGEVGSASHGTHGGVLDDYDLMGVVVPPARYVIGLSKWEHWDYGPDDDGLDVKLYSLAKYVRLLLKSNPNVMGLMWLAPHNVLVAEPAWRVLRRSRDLFVSKQAYRSFVGYAHGQLERMEKGRKRGYMGKKRTALLQKFGYDVKNASHLVRLLRMGIEYLRTGALNVDRTNIDADELLAIKRGDWTLAEVKKEADRLFARAEAARDDCTLPEEPNRDEAEALVVDLHRHFLIPTPTDSAVQEGADTDG